MDTEKNVLITGVSAGIGHALAKEYLRRGATVFGCSRKTPTNLMDHAKFRFAPMDLTQHDQVASTMQSLLGGTPRVHLAVLNAGALGTIRDLRETPLADAQALVDINLWANKTLLDVLLNGDIQVDQVVTISSGAAVNGNRGWGAYAISKAALNMLTKLYAEETPNTHFCALAPGIVDTVMQEQLCSSDPDPRYPSLDVLRSHRHTDGMPTPERAAPLLADAIERVPRQVESGSFADVRSLQEG